MRPGYDLPALVFEREEVEAVAVGVQLLTRTGDRDLQAAAEFVKGLAHMCGTDREEALKVR